MPDSFLNQLGLGTPDYSGLAGSNEKKRQQLINLGLSQINAVFGGGSAPFYQMPSSFDPSQTYYRLEKSGFQPYWSQGKGLWNMPEADKANQVAELGTLFAAGSPFAGAAASTASTLAGDYQGAGANLLTMGGYGTLAGLFGGSPETPLEHVKKGFKKGQLLTQSTQTFPGFTPDFYKAREKAYIDYALPQLSQQARATGDSIKYGLANRGLTESGSARAQYGEYGRELGQAKQQIGDTAVSQAQQLQNQVENARSQAIQYLYQTGNPSQAAAGAINTAASLQQPSTFAPIGSAFSNLLTNYYTNALLGAQQPTSLILPPNYSGSGGGGFTQTAGALPPPIYG